jgi:type III secretion protein Q
MTVSPFPFASLPKVRASDVGALRAALAWLDGAAGQSFDVLGASVAFGAAVIGRRPLPAASGLAWLTRQGARALVAVPGIEVRELARRLLSMPLELDAPRPLTSAEQGVMAMAVAALLAQLDSAAQVEPWQPFPDLRAALSRTERMIEDWPCLSLVMVLDGRAAEACVWIPPATTLSRPLGGRRPQRHLPVGFSGAVVVATAPLARDAVGRLQERDVIVVAPVVGGAELRLGRGSIGLSAPPGAAQAVVETSYVRRVMEPLPDDLHLELTVTLGTLRLSLRQLSELAVGQVVSLGRPLQGPFELRADGRIIGTGELVDVDGALGVRVLSLVGE